ncbi:hypothetical protein P9C27_06720 [Bacillus vallismortis]|uniref:hypothetical protein n=1 Tax=Bacillus vallismortis TaxID=72361 RepID=UPI002DB5FADA|nr:hypothetical protein [Bacillus vallismortis]MEC1268256.1 hypothetical protein [Bacillus vallismortis]
MNISAAESRNSTGAIFLKKSPPYGGEYGFDLWVLVLKKAGCFQPAFSILAKPKSGLFLS